MASAIVVKTIKPGRFRGQQAVNILLGATRKAGNDIKKDFEKTTKTWNHRVKFQMLFEVKNVGPTVFVGTDDEVYEGVNSGSPRHLIFPVSAQKLVYQSNYEPKTRPGVIDSFGGGKWGVNTVRAWVEHPGNANPRRFDEAIQRKWEPIFRRRIEEAMRRAAAATGHAI